MSATPHYRLDDLRRFAAALAAPAGVPPARASALASHLLRLDADGAARFGIATLTDLLDRIEAGAIDPATEGAVVGERGGTASYDGRRGVPLIVLEAAGRVATAKAREVGVGLVRVENLDPPGPSGGVAAGIAVAGPFLGFVLGPGDATAAALPGEGTLPVVIDTALAAVEVAPAVSVLRLLCPDGGCLVAAVALTGLESFAAFNARLAAAVLGDLGATPGLRLPGPSSDRFAAAHAQGVPVESAIWEEFTRRATRLGVTPPAPLPARSDSPPL